MVDRVASDLGRGLADRILGGFERAHNVVSQSYFARDIEADHGNRNSRLKDDTRGLWIHIEVELGGGRDVSSRKRSTHHHNSSYHAGEFRVGIECGGDIRQGA